MATVRPFKGIRPSRDKVHLVASRSVDTYKPAELNSKLAENPYTFLHIIKPKFTQEQKVNVNSPEYLKKIKGNYDRFIKEGIFETEHEQAFYIYRQEKDGNTYTGIIGCASIDDYFSGVIKIHEQTLTNKEEKLRDYLEVCDFNAEPVCLTYPADAVIDQTVDSFIKAEPVYDFTTTDRVRHKLWRVDEEQKVRFISDRFKAIPAVYIADGHHRSASSALLGKKKREQNPGFTGEEPFNYFMAAFFPEHQLKIFDFNRVVKDLNGLREPEFLGKLEEKFIVEEKGTNDYKPEKLHNISMYLEGQWYSLIAKPGTYVENDPVESLDVSILSKHVLGPVLGIHDLKTDKRIGFVPGVKGMHELKAQVDTAKAKVAFGLYPVTMEQLKAIADTGNIMPPKSTWVEPKLRSGLVIYSLGSNF
jgi:uncharacterized protein (DUF1015 family)